VASALVYGTSIVFQHSEASKHTDEGKASKTGLLNLLRNPVWLLAIAGDFVGFLLQIAALSTGVVVVIQPLVVLMLPVALVVGWLTGGPRPGLYDYLGSVGIIGGLGLFLALIGSPKVGHVPHPHNIAFAVLLVLVVGVIAALAVTGRSATVRGVVYGLVAGAYFGTLAVMVDAASEQASRHGWHGLFLSPRGLVPLVGILLLGLGGIVLTQVSFQVGALAATLPASLAADPFVAVLIGAILLREHLPMSGSHLVLYAVCLAVIVAGAIRLARPATAPHPVHVR
jgi:drug/metabolite transporter (DMT)-like permease